MSKHLTYWKDSVVFITGAGSGIGKAFAIALSQLNCKVYIADINFEAAQEVAKICGNKGVALALDVRDLDQYKKYVADIISKEGCIDFLFNNAGMALAGEAHEFSEEAWNRIIDINIKGVINGITTIYPQMIEQGKGHIINTSSLSGVAPLALFTPYSMTKFAIVGLSNSLRLEAKEYGVNVSVLCPAAVDTPLLDNENPKDLAEIKSAPDVRAFLSEITGNPDSAQKFAEAMLKEIPKGKGMIFYPKKAKEIWKISRYFPTLLSKLGDKALSKERAKRKS